MQGFIPASRASLMLDVVVVAMFAVIPLMVWSIYLVRIRRNYKLHRKVNIAIAGTLFFAVVLFEVDMRLNGWRHLAVASSLYETWVNPALYIHLVFAISTVILWIMTLVSAMREFSSKPKPTPGRNLHRRFARFAALGMCGTAVSGWVFYVAAFMY
jgi:uncharacterized membrane protein YozB (DUF420 family)